MENQLTASAINSRYCSWRMLSHEVTADEIDQQMVGRDVNYTLCSLVLQRKLLRYILADDPCYMLFSFG